MTKSAFLFPGQGAQFVGMGQDAMACSAARELFDRAADVLGYDLAEICREGPAERLASTAISQPALFVCSLASLERLREDSGDVVESCAATAGLSLGEYTAITFAGVVDFETGLGLVDRRGRAMQAAAEAAPSGMVSLLGLSAEDVEALCGSARREGEVLQTANLLCPGNIVVSGHQAACDRIVQMAGEAGAMKAIPLSVAGAFHTPLMESAVAELTAALTDITLKPPRIPVVSNVDARPHDDPEEIRKLLVQQVVEPVHWEASMRWLIDQNCDKFYEIGPGRVLRGLLRRIERKVVCDSVE